MAPKVTAPRGKRGGVLIRRTNDLIDYWAERITTRPDYDEWRESSSIIMRGDTLYHYGTHFPLALVIRHPNGRARIVLLNGDQWSSAGFGPTTTSRQFQVRDVVNREIAGTRIQTLTVPFSALEAADIVKSSIKPLEVREDRWVRTDTAYATDELPSSVYTDDWDESRYVYNHGDGPRRLPVEQREDGKWIVPEFRHWLADSLFSANVKAWDRNTGETTERRAKFLSSFDYNEESSPYFMCELPRTSARTVDEALEALKPKAVKDAMSNGVDVLRQGDVFALPTSLTTKELKSRATSHTFRVLEAKPCGECALCLDGCPHYCIDQRHVWQEAQTAIRSRTKHGAGADILNTNHRATNVIVTEDGDYYGRGFMYHDPSGWRTPDHARLKLGDGKTWYRLVKNTVPKDRTGIHHGRSALVNQSGSNRAWTLGGRVD